MSRRSLISLVMLFADKADTPENRFSAAYNEWVEQRKKAVSGTINAHELRLWSIVKDRWNELRKHIDAEY